ncbi:MAG: hypothetical protein IKH45_08205 [Neisseriaceae bacterium]|nr:hypothetical protein [Neisseriaceae bacterium]
MLCFSWFIRLVQKMHKLGLRQFVRKIAQTEFLTFRQPESTSRAGAALPVQGGHFPCGEIVIARFFRKKKSWQSPNYEGRN